MAEEAKEPAAPAAAEKAAGGETKKKKISRMSLAELDQAIESTRKHMGGTLSDYGRALVERKEILNKMK